MVPLHPSLTFPQSSPCGQVVFGVHEPTVHSPALHVPVAHEPQGMMPPQPSLTEPQTTFAGHAVFGVQVVTQLPAMHASPGGQVPHGRMLPQPSPMGPQATFCAEQVVATHTGGGVTHEPRSKIMNSSIFSWGVISVDVHSFGNVVPFVDASSTWKSE